MQTGHKDIALQEQNNDMSSDQSIQNNNSNIKTISRTSLMAITIHLLLLNPRITTQVSGSVT